MAGKGDNAFAEAPKEEKDGKEEDEDEEDEDEEAFDEKEGGSASAPLWAAMKAAASACARAMVGKRRGRPQGHAVQTDKRCSRPTA